MDRGEVREMIARGAGGRLSRREVLARLAMLGLSSSAIASARPRPTRAAAPARRGESGVVKVLYWQARPRS